ncbi:AraC family transcriptional regulator [bacterium]|nr:MAG: AraC family transcriptional regulator [bacterium]
MSSTLSLGGHLPLDSQRAGLMMSRGIGRHINRTADFFVLLFVREGVLHIEELGTAFEVQAGQSLLLWPGRRHGGTKDYDENLQFYWLHFNLTDIGEDHPALSIPQYTNVTRPDFVTELFRRYLDDQETGHLQPLGAALYSWMILMEISDTRPPLDTGAATSLAGRAYAFVRTHFHEKITASDVAFALGYNSQYLGRVFQRTYNQSLAEAIRRARISHAKSLLLHTNHNVGEIARLSGFEDTTYFQRVFKQLEGMTPLRFRRLHARMMINNS